MAATPVVETILVDPSVDVNMESYCGHCRKKTPSKDGKIVPVGGKSHGRRIASHCALMIDDGAGGKKECGVQKSRFLSKPGTPDVSVAGPTKEEEPKH